MTHKKKSHSSAAENVSRRDFLRVGGASVVGLSLAEAKARAAVQKETRQKNCIFIRMTGGASQLETFDPKPKARSTVRGPLHDIPTSVPGIHLSESLPKLAKIAEKYSLIRTLYYDDALVHETGTQLLFTGRLSHNGVRFPSFGSVIAQKTESNENAFPYVLLRGEMKHTNLPKNHGELAGSLGEKYDPKIPCTDEETHQASSLEIAVDVPVSERKYYGEHNFGMQCLQARRLIENGARCVVIDQFDELDGQLTWDSHGKSEISPARLFDYRDELCPRFDQAVAALISDLDQRGLLESTLVVATGEFGRTPQINRFDGRDHWHHAWSALIAGGGIHGGNIVGETDEHAAYPLDRPVHVSELTATIYHAMGFDPAELLAWEIDDETKLIEAEPIHELFV